MDKSSIFNIHLSLLVGFALHTGADDWTPITPPDAPEARHGHSMVTLPDGRVMLFGGEDVSGHLFNDLHTFDGAWNEVVPENDPPPARRDHQAWVRNQQMYVTGGFGESNLLDDTWRYDIENNEWRQVTHSGPRPSPRYNHGVVSAGNATYIFGGTDEDGIPLADFWKLNPDGSYTYMGDASYSFADPELQIAGDIMCVFGRPGMVAMYHFIEQRWGYFQGPPVGSGSSTTLAENAQGEPVILLFGGQDGEGQESAKVYEYNTATGEVTQKDNLPFAVENGAAAQVEAQEQFTQEPMTLASAQLESALTGDGVGQTPLAELQMVFFGGVTDGVPTTNTLLYSQLRFTDVSRSASSGTVLTWQSVPGLSYRLEGTTNVTDPVFEKEVATGIEAESLSHTYTDSTENADRMFYRVVEE
ncbi:MAG: hypothetical protein K9N52_09765 [Verrucomicrobia bacterium]|nr:hypothetical protein [Verrucomicrobiota bacterium]